MTSRERSVRLLLPISESRETGTGRFLSTYAGAGVQHIAMAAEDIVSGPPARADSPSVTVGRDGSRS